MVILRILSLDIPPDTTHRATDWQVATDILFNNIILRSDNNSIDKTVIIFPDTLDPGIKYYARARSLLDPLGYTIWGNIDVFIPKDINDVALDIDMPTGVSLPIITTDSIQNEHDLTMFTISVSGFSVIGNSKHASTTWLIEDLEKNTIWKRERDNNNKTSIQVIDTILNYNTPHVIKAIFHTTSNDSSEIAAYTICTINNTNNILITEILDINVNAHYYINLKDNINITTSELTIYNIDNMEVSLVYNEGKTNNVLEYVIPPNTLKQEKYYIIKIITNLSNKPLYIPFNTY